MPRREMTGVVTEGGGWEPLPAGDYTIQFDKVDYNVSKNGNEQMLLKGHVVGGAHDGKNTTIFYALAPKSLWKVKALLEAANIDYDVTELEPTQDGAPQETVGFDDEDLLGAEVLYTVSQREYNGKMQNNFEKERAPDGAKPKPAPQAQAQAPASQPQRQAQQPAQAAPQRARRTTGAA